MKEHFKTMLPHRHRSEYFRHFARLWARQMKHPMPTATDEDFEEMWGMLDSLPSFETKSGCPKSARWFSVNESIDSTREEFWPLKMMLRFYLYDSDAIPDDDLIDPAHLAGTNPRTEFNKMRQQMSGMKLAEQLYTEWLRNGMHIYYYGAKATWTFYTAQVQHGSQPVQQLRRYCNWTTGSWVEKELSAPSV